MNLVDAFQHTSLRKNISVYKSDEFDSGFPSSSASSCYEFLESKLKNELIRSEKRRSALADSLRSAYHAIEYQKNCLEWQDHDITSSKSTLESLLMRQELLESRFSNLKHCNLYPHVLSLGVSEKQAHQSSRYPSEATHNGRINALEREIIHIKDKMRSYGSIWAESNVSTQNVCQDRKGDEAEAMENEGLRQHAELMEAQRERDVLELQITSLHSGLHQAKVTSKELEKECVKLQSQITANRNINESLHLEVSALKQHNHTLENAVKGSESEKKSLHVQVESLQKEKQILASQKELLFEIMKKKGKQKYHSEKLNRRTPEIIQTNANNERKYMSSTSGSSISQAPSLRHSRRRRRKEKKCHPKEHKSSQSNDCQIDCDREENAGNSGIKEEQVLEESELNVKDGNSLENDTHRYASTRSELNTDIIFACYQHLADLLSQLECLKMSNVRLDNEKEQILTFLLRSIKDFQDWKINNESSREQVEKLLNQRMDLRENNHKRMNQITAVIIELKHLRKAYNGLFSHSQDPDDKKAMQWISRVQAIKDSLKLLQEA
ncbi:microtubule-associated tumor suppressor 1 homolog [Bufo gargarizans]|uniref:microtubule-associated tumor suppressor 1 homolog n=1 Tax=Bufo gargarizans TaxID=30331 RepID=UPI001CF46948|nr:microtubule-associated tumor suppressor 1 homolog [Bufo gargarizans]